MTNSDNPNFSTVARKALIDRNWTMTKLAQKVRRPLASVSKAIHHNRFPLLREEIARALKIAA